LRILYVEDNDLVRDITTEMLDHENRHIVAVGSAEEALSVFEPRGFDVVVTDVSLPVMSGLELARELLRRDAAVLIIVATGYPLDATDALLGDRVRVILKPFEQCQMDQAIDSLVATVVPESAA